MTPEEMRKRAGEIRNAADANHEEDELSHRRALRDRAALYDIGAGIIDALESIRWELQESREQWRNQL